MAMYIRIDAMPDIVWHVGKNTDKLRDLVPAVIEVQADGHELEHIRNTFTNLPIKNARVVRWYGEMAKFIVGNL